MWWIVIIVSSLILGQMFLLEDENDSINSINKFFIIVCSLALYIGTLLIVSFNSFFITSTIKDYEKGIIIKVETTTIQGADTTKTIKYKYK